VKSHPHPILATCLSVILPSISWCFKWSPLKTFPHRILCAFLVSPHPNLMSILQQPHRFHYLNNKQVTFINHEVARYVISKLQNYKSKYHTISKRVLWNVVRECIRKFPESITQYTLTTMNTRWDATQRVVVAKLTRMTHRIVIQLHLVAESSTIFVLAPGGQSGNFWIYPRNPPSHTGPHVLLCRRKSSVEILLCTEL
jgi:hypothetical protein